MRKISKEREGQQREERGPGKENMEGGKDRKKKKEKGKRERKKKK